MVQTSKQPKKFPVKSRLQPILDILPIVAKGDFSRRLEIPEKGDDFKELYVGINNMLEILSKNIRKWERAEEAVRESEEKFRTLFEASPEGIVIIDLDGTILECNHATEKISGRKKKELLGKSFIELNRLFGKDLARMKELFPKVINEEFRETVEVNIKTGKEKKIIEVYPAPLKKDDKVHVLQLTIRDITERKRIEEARRAIESKYRTLLENLPQKIFLKDRNSVYISCNENYARDLKIKADEISGKTDYDFYPKELAEKYRADDRKIMKEGEIEEIEEKYIENCQEVIVHTVKVPVKDETGNIMGVLGIFWDITDRKHAEQTLQKTTRDLERFNRLAIGRELQMIELKREVNSLLQSFGQKQKYKVPTMTNNENKKE